MVERKRMTICVGDIHGHLDKLRNLWRNLEAKLGLEAFQVATVIFLGDYNDRGPDTKGVLDFLVSLPQRYPEQRHVFLCGNHDFAFAAFLGVLPTPPSHVEYSSTWAEFQPNEEREGWWSGPGQEDIHLQVRIPLSLSPFLVFCCFHSHCNLGLAVKFTPWEALSITMFTNHAVLVKLRFEDCCVGSG